MDIQLAHKLNHRRLGLGMSYRALAARSGVSEAAVQRIMTGQLGGARFENVFAIAKAMGLSLDANEDATVLDFRQSAARAKARQVAGMVHATSALEGQAPSTDTIAEVEEQTVHELMAGPKRYLWTP